MVSVVDMTKYGLSVFVDESGSITKTDIANNKFFIIAILFTRDSVRLKRYFRKGIANLLKVEKYKSIFVKNNEIKGSEVSETKKKDIYDRIIRNCKDDFELGIVVLDNNYTTDAFIKNTARTFNYVFQTYLDNLFRKHSKYASNTNIMHILLDEQNIATDAKYTLDGYLEQQLAVVNPLCNRFEVKYADSKNHALLQFIDFVSNTFYRNIEKHIETSVDNAKMLLDCVCGKRLFDFSVNHGIEIYLGKKSGEASLRNTSKVQKTTQNLPPPQTSGGSYENST